MEVLVDSIHPIQPLAIKTPIIEIEADYGNPVVDVVVCTLVLVGVFLFHRWCKKGGM